MIKPKLEHDKRLILLGSVYYGKIENSWGDNSTIAELWKEFSKITFHYSDIIKRISPNPYYGYELHYEPFNFKEERKKLIMIAVQTEYFETYPLEFNAKKLPKTTYLCFTTKMKDKSEIFYYVFKTWMKENNYKQGFPYILQGYDNRRFTGFEDSNSEIDWFIPVDRI